MGWPPVAGVGYPLGVLAVICAVASSLMYAFASVLQQRGAAQQPADQSLRLGLLSRLLRNPGWVLGLGCDAAGYAFQFVALGHGPLVIVQPLLVCGILFALPIGAAWAGRRLHRSDWFAALLVCAGLAVFLVVANPRSGRDDARPVVWVLLLGTTAAAALVLVAFSRGRAPRRRALLLSGAAGVVYGAAAALTKTSSHLLSRGVFDVVLHWQPYLLVVTGVGGMVIAQSAFQAGSLDVSLPTMSVTDPVVSILIGALAFQEGIASGPGAVGTEVASLIAIAAGVTLLARAEAVDHLPGSPNLPP
jgi:drug/metabolite transporter (DMT)-like permease